MTLGGGGEAPGVGRKLEMCTEGTKSRESGRWKGTQLWAEEPACGVKDWLSGNGVGAPDTQ